MENMHTRNEYYRNKQPSAAMLLEAMTPEELSVWKKCNEDATYNAGIPTAAICGILTHFGVKSGRMKTYGKFGATPVIATAAIFGYMLGRFSYSSLCLERVMAVPNSNIRKIFLENVPAYQLQNRRYSSLEAQRPTEIVPSSPNSSLDLDTYQSPGSFDGSDGDVPINADEDLSDESNIQQRPSTTYTELREKNRQDFMQTRDRRMYPSLPPVSRPPPSPSTETITPSVRRNKYGDVWD